MRRRRDFNTLFQKGLRRSNRWFTLVFQPGSPAPGEKVAFVVSKKTGHAPLRNRLKRRMREVYRRQLQQEILPGRQIWMARAVAAELPFPEFAGRMIDLHKFYQAAAAANRA